MTTIKLASGVLAIPMLSLTLALAAAEVRGTPTDPAPSVAKSGQHSESENWLDETVGLGVRSIGRGIASQVIHPSLKGPAFATKRRKVPSIGRHGTFVSRLMSDRDRS